MVNKPLLLIMFLMLIIPMSTAVDVDYIYKINDDAEIKVACFDTDSTLCTNTTNCYITVHDPDGMNIVNKQAMTFGEAYYSYNISGTSLSKKGEYPTTVNCEGTYNGYTSFLFGITSNGERPGDSGVAGIGVLILIILITVGAFALARVQFSKNQILAYILRGGCVLMGLYLLSLDMTIAVTLADNFTLGINAELFRFLWLINWTIYITMFIVIFRYLVGTLQLWSAKKTLRRMGLDNLE